MNEPDSRDEEGTKPRKRRALPALLGSLGVGVFLLCAGVGAVGWYAGDFLKMMYDDLQNNRAIDPQPTGPPDPRIQRLQNRRIGGGIPQQEPPNEPAPAPGPAPEGKGPQDG
jgi:hypothetical protein